MPSSSSEGKKEFSAPLPAFGFGLVQDASTVRRANRSAVLRAVRWHGPLSRREVAQIAGLASATAFSIVEELAADGLLIDLGVGESTGGRRPTLYGFNPKAFYAIGIDVGGMGV